MFDQVQNNIWQRCMKSVWVQIQKFFWSNIKQRVTNMFVFRYKDTPLFEIGRILRREGPLTKQMIIDSQEE